MDWLLPCHKAVPARELDKAGVPAAAGLYAIEATGGVDSFQPHYAAIFRKRRDGLLYVGKAAGRGGLRTRLLDNELRQRGAGTFFRSLGVVLGYGDRVRPLKSGCNYSFENTEEIIRWINVHLLVSWRPAPVRALSDHEKALIRRYRPMLNIIHNVDRIDGLRKARRECARLARARYCGESRC